MNPAVPQQLMKLTLRRWSTFTPPYHLLARRNTVYFCSGAYIDGSLWTVTEDGVSHYPRQSVADANPYLKGKPLEVFTTQQGPHFRWYRQYARSGRKPMGRH